MKKILSLLLALFVCLTLAACGENKTNNNAGDMVSDGISRLESGAEGIVSGTESVVEGAMGGTNASNGSKLTLTAKISAKEATSAALQHAGLKEDQVTGVDVDLDRDNGRLIYEVDFNSGNIEYDYDIDAETGDIISADKDRE